MGKSRIWAAGLATVVALGFPPPALAGADGAESRVAGRRHDISDFAPSGGSFFIANTASDLGEPVPRGALLSVFTDAPVSPEDARFDPWAVEGPDGLRVMAACTVHTMAILPIVAVKSWGTGHKIDVYYPNGMGEEPFGPCDNDGDGEIWLIPARGFGPAIEQTVVTVNGHPGIFKIGIYPDGQHINRFDNTSTSFVECARDPAFCPVRTADVTAELVVRLTGTERFVCKPCGFNNIFFELAPVIDGVVGEYQAQELLSVFPVAMGEEQARLRLLPDLDGGEYRLRVRNTIRPDIMPAPLTILLGSPN